MRTYIFGPVPSRRLGISLGVDLTPTKTCSFDCLYCQLDRTRFHTSERSRFCPPVDVLQELREVLNEVAAPDWITFSGTGEPTLHVDLGLILSELKKFSPSPVCVITNSSLLYREDVREELMNADRLLPTLTTVNEATFRKIHRPTSDIRLSMILDGLRKMAENFKGIIEIEIFVCPGINDSDEEILGLSEFIKSLKNISSIYLNTAVRVPVEDEVITADHVRLQEFRDKLDLKIPVITAFERKTIPARPSKWNRATAEADILKLLLRHPCNEEQLAQVLDSDKARVALLLVELSRQGKVKLQANGEWKLIES
ncbi:MAG: hypothetical protein PWR01_3707 [Clostridiales bacterium]|jgi:wyosine [tRNA(Phe)-imidazoG37] synthetase (radical SAM superfamily)|nr:hypothetical protein [Clostridiales bacterium]MDN5282634.1 hypothetical protein [Candidatus Ozemobacter sp.]